ncbi:MAG: hypothetical protein RL701_1806 [Pseudomonadota bacterium]|jgi:AraC-like DNA-binding protein
MLVTAAEDAGVERQRFLDDARISMPLLDDSSARLPAADYQRIVRAALSSTGDPALGLHMGERAGTGCFDVLGHLAESSPNLRDALEMCDRYSRIATEGPRLELQEHDAIATVRFEGLGEDPLEAQLVAEFSTTALLGLIRRFVASTVQPDAVLFSYPAPAPAHRAEYTRVFRGYERFSQAFSGLQFDRSWLDRKRLNYSRALWTHLQARAEHLLTRLEHEAPATERVKRWLAADPLQTKPTMELAARALGMSGRSLRRRLSDEGAVYSDLLEQAQATRAKGLLADERRSVQEAAFAMGFATPNAFTRAFKRWTGRSPSAHRAAR